MILRILLRMAINVHTYIAPQLVREIHSEGMSHMDVALSFSLSRENRINSWKISFLKSNSRVKHPLVSGRFNGSITIK